MTEDILQIAQAAAVKLKGGVKTLGGYDSRTKWKDWEKSVPDINPIYRQTLLHHHEVAVHAQKGVFPYKLLQTKAPNQSPEEWEYQMGLYEPYTRSAWGRALNRTKIIANKQNYSIKGWDEEQAMYFYDDYPLYHSLESWFFDIVREQKINYPNRLLIIEPWYIPGRTNEEGVFIPDQSVPISPVARIIAEENIIAYRDNEYTLILEGKHNDWPSFKLFDKDAIYSVIAVKTDKDNKPIYEAQAYYVHNWGYVPTRKLAGKPTEIDGEIFYESPFSEAIPELNGVVRMSSNLDMSTNTNLFPVRIQRIDECSYRNDHGFCQSGRIWTVDEHGGGHWGTCPSCNGTGKANRYSPTGVIEIPMKDNTDTAVVVNDVVNFVSPPIDALQFVDKRITAKMENAFAFLFKTSDKVQNTASGAVLEKEEFHSFILQLSNELFDLMEFTFEAVGFMRYMDTFVMPSISRPTSFQFRDSEEITAEINTAKAANMPSSYLKQLIEQSTATRFNSDDMAEREIMAQMELDPLWSKTDMEIRPFLNVTISPVEAIMHQQFTSLIEMAEGTIPNFWELGRGEQYDILYTEAKRIYDRMKAETGQSQLSAAAILGG